MPQSVPIRHHITEYAEPRDAAVGEDAQPHVCGVNSPDRKHVVGISSKRRPFYYRLPHGSRQVVMRRRSRHDARLEAARLRKVALEIGRIDLDGVDDALSGELDDAVVVRNVEAGFTRQHVPTTTRFPPVHPLSAIGVLAVAPHRCRRMRQPLFRCEELVARKQRNGAQRLGCEIDRMAAGEVDVSVHSSCPDAA